MYPEEAVDNHFYDENINCDDDELFYDNYTGSDVIKMRGHDGIMPLLSIENKDDYQTKIEDQVIDNQDVGSNNAGNNEYGVRININNL